MVKIESLKDYVGVLSKEEFKDLSTKIYMITDFICADYPKHKSWYFEKQLPETIANDERNILFARNPENENEIIAMACLKRDDEEKKICTLFVDNKCRGLGLGTKIIESSMDWLETKTPLATIADYKLEMFRPIIKKYDWKLTQIVSGLYNDRASELCFNGVLTEDAEPVEYQLYRRMTNALKNRINSCK